MTTTIDQALRNKIKALTTLDMNYARRKMPNVRSDEARLIAMHKTRYECIDIDDDLRHISRRWLQDRKFSRLQYVPWLPDDQLPE